MTKRKIRISEAVSAFGHTINCPGCGRGVHIADLQQRWPLQARLDEIEARLVCTRCGHRGGVIHVAGPQLGADMGLRD